MTIQFKVDSTYTLGSSIKLICTYIEDNTVWLKSDSYPSSDTTLLYKLDRKSKKLYLFNTKVQAYDLVENTLSEYGSDSSHTSEIWDFRMKGGVSNYLE